MKLKNRALITAVIASILHCSPLVANEHNETRSTTDIKILEPSQDLKAGALQINTDPILGPAKSVREKLGAGSTGGGQGKDGFLRDLESDMPELVCNYKMSEFVRDMYTFESLLSAIEKVNAGFAFKLREETRRITLCAVRGELSPDLVANQDGVIISPSAYDQLAIRAAATNGIDVYIANQAFNEMASEQHQSFLLFHELLHSFMQTKPEVSYINRLRSVNNRFYQLYSKDSFSQQALNDIAKMYRMQGYSTPAECFLTQASSDRPNQTLLKQCSVQAKLSLRDKQRIFYDLIENYQFNPVAMEYLIDSGIDFHSSYWIDDTFLRTPMDIAVSSENFTAMRLFNQKGAVFTEKHAESIAEDIGQYDFDADSYAVIQELKQHRLLNKSQRSRIYQKLNSALRARTVSPELYTEIENLLY